MKWLETMLEYALKVNDDTVKSAFPALYANIAKCHEELGNHSKAKENYSLSTSFRFNPSDKGPFYHGTKSDCRFVIC